jgi:GrpB-like predicted nucleotidyltransferase (UPF0157 family)
VTFWSSEPEICRRPTIGHESIEYALLACLTKTASGPAILRATRNDNRAGPLRAGVPHGGTSAIPGRRLASAVASRASVRRVSAPDPSKPGSPSDANLIGGVEKRAILIADYDPSWPERFVTERARISKALGPTAVTIDHIGSTAVPGLAAKPIIDIAVGITDVEDDDAYVPALLAAGYEMRVQEPAHRLLRTPALDVHVHVYNSGSRPLADYRTLRDHLRRNAADRELYAMTKRQLAAMEWPSMNHYAEAKTDVITDILRRAEAHAQETSECPTPG